MICTIASMYFRSAYRPCGERKDRHPSAGGSFFVQKFAEANAEENQRRHFGSRHERADRLGDGPGTSVSSKISSSVPVILTRGKIT